MDIRKAIQKAQQLPLGKAGHIPPLISTLNSPEKSTPKNENAGVNLAVCSLCGDVGFIRRDVPVGHAEFGRLILCACQQKRISERLQMTMGTKFNKQKMFADVLERGAGSRAMKRAALVFVETPFGFLTIFGMTVVGTPSSANGNGKTTCLQAIVNECVERGIASVYLTASDMIEFLKAGIGDEDYDVESRLGVLSGIPVLCIDELSQPSWTDWVEDKMSTLINRRYSGDVGTVLALDNNPATFLHRRIYSRLQEGVLIQNSDPDMRPFLGWQ